MLVTKVVLTGGTACREWTPTYQQARHQANCRCIHAGGNLRQGFQIALATTGVLVVGAGLALKELMPRSSVKPRPDEPVAWKELTKYIPLTYRSRR